MTSVTINDAPPDTAKAATPSATIIVDSKGRRLTIERPNILAESRLVRALGDDALNAAYVTGYVLPAAMVTAIDDEPALLPVTRVQIEASIQRLGHEGMLAVANHIQSLVEDVATGLEGPKA